MDENFVQKISFDIHIVLKTKKICKKNGQNRSIFGDGLMLFKIIQYAIKNTIETLFVGNGHNCGRKIVHIQKREKKRRAKTVYLQLLAERNHFSITKLL